MKPHPAKQEKSKPVKPREILSPSCEGIELPRSFTVSQMEHQAQELLRAAKKYGQVEIRESGGATFLVIFNTSTVEQSHGTENFLDRHRLYRERMLESGFQPGTQEDAECLQRMISGEA